MRASDALNVDVQSYRDLVNLWMLTKAMNGFMVIMCTLFLGVVAAGQQRGVRIRVSPIERRVALVIGNGAYDVGPLRNPTNDARDVAKALTQIGFEVIHKENLTQNEMKRAIRGFGEKLRGGGVGLFYFAGHGIQVNGQNYLIPVGATINSEHEVEYESVDLGLVLAQMENAQNELNLLILDACRNNPFARSFRSSNRGLAPIIAPSGTLIAYATAPGSVASDGSGVNGLYTEALLVALRVPGLKIEDVFKRVRVALEEKTGGKQVPWESTSLTGDFYFIKTENAVTPIDSSSSPPIPRPRRDKVDEVQHSEAGRVTIDGTGYIAGLSGRLNPILDSSNRTYLYADNIAIEEGKNQPVGFSLDQPVLVEDSLGNRFELNVVSITQKSSVIEYKRIYSDADKHRATLRVKVVDENSQPIEGAQLLAIFADGTYLQGVTDSKGKASIAQLKHQIVTIYCAHRNYSAFYKENNDAHSDVSISLKAIPGSGSVIINSTGYIPGLDGRLAPILDTSNRMYLYAKSISIENGKNQPADFNLNEPFQLEDSKGKRFELKIIAIKARSSLIQFTRLN